MIASLPARALLVAALVGAGSVANAQSATAPQASATGAPAPLVLYFNSGSSTIRPQDEAVLDHASRLFNEGRPIVMIVSGATDSVGRPDQNLLLSEHRALAVLHGLVARGIPAERFQVLAKGETEPAVSAAEGIPEERNRRVEITWR